MEFIVKQRDFIGFIIKSTIAVIIPSTVLVLAAFYLTNYFVGNAESFLPKPMEINRIVDFIGTVILSPLIETYILVKLVQILRAIGIQNIYLCIIAGIIFGVFHSLFGLLWFFGPCWAFMVFSYNYLTWEGRNAKLAFWAACIPHMLNNSFAFILVSFYK